MVWSSTTKTMPVLSWANTPPVSTQPVTLPFVPPGRVGSLSFDPVRFFLAVAIAVARKRTPFRVIQSQMIASYQAISLFVEDSGPDLLLDKGIGALNEFKTSSAAHDLGVAAAHLLADKLGYHWHDLADTYFPDLAKPRKCPDMLFESGQGRNAFIAIEAKGTTSGGNTNDPKSFKKMVKKSCREQVGNVIGHAPFGGTQVVHGYTIGACVRRGGERGAIHVCEIAPPQGPVQPPGGGSSGGAPAAAAPRQSTTPQMSSAVQTLLTGTLLIGDVEALELVTEFQNRFASLRDHPAVVEDVEFGLAFDAPEPHRVEYRERKYYLGQPIPASVIAPGLQGTFHFAVDAALRGPVLERALQSSQLEDFFATVRFDRRFGRIDQDEEDPSVVMENGLALLHSDAVGYAS